MKLSDLVDWLNDYLQIYSVPNDQSLNGLQVEASSDVEKVAVAVDATLETFRKAEGADLLIVHHGLYWRNLSPTITGVMVDRARALLDRKMSLYAAHLPLDVHPEVGNNVQIIRALGFEPIDIADSPSWYCNANVSFDELYDRVEHLIIKRFGTINPLRFKFVDEVSRLVVGSGGGTSHIFSMSPGDTFLVGEFSHYGLAYARERKINVISAGHYATETFGVRALGEKIREKFDIDVTFIEAPTGL